MKALRNYLNKIKPNFEDGGKLHAFRSVFDGFETFLYVPNDTAKAGGVNIHDLLTVSWLFCQRFWLATS